MALAQRRRRQQCGGGGGSTPAVAAVWQHCGVSSGSKAVGATLPLHTATVVMKTPAATMMAGAQTTINNLLCNWE